MYKLFKTKLLLVAAVFSMSFSATCFAGCSNFGYANCVQNCNSTEEQDSNGGGYFDECKSDCNDSWC